MSRRDLNTWQILALGAGLAACSLLSHDWSSPQDRLAECKSNLKNLGTALEMYSTDWAGKYPSSLAQLTPNYLKTIPQCPNTEASYADGVETGPHAAHNTQNYQDYYYVCCKGLNHEDAGLHEQPWFDGICCFVERATDGHRCTPECPPKASLRQVECAAGKRGPALRTAPPPR